jgi:hypothetical protein
MLTCSLLVLFPYCFPHLVVDRVSMTDADQSRHLETVRTMIYGNLIDLVHLRTETYSEEGGRIPRAEFGSPAEGWCLKRMRGDA